MCMRWEKKNYTEHQKIQKNCAAIRNFVSSPEPLDFFSGFPSWKCCNDWRFLMPPKGFLYLSGGELFRDAGSGHFETKTRIYSSSSGFG